MAAQEINEHPEPEKPKDEPIKDSNNEEPPGPLSLDAKPVGPGDLFNLGGKPGGSPYGGRGGGPGGSYGAWVSAQIQSALQANSRTRKAVMQTVIRVWVDQTGRVTKVTLTPSTGDAELDSIIRNDVLGNLTLRQPPPRDTPMPLIHRVTESRPG
jgi:outer membrane biosynthesis protein TonB